MGGQKLLFVAVIAVSLLAGFFVGGGPDVLRSDSAASGRSPAPERATTTTEQLLAEPAAPRATLATSSPTTTEAPTTTAVTPASTSVPATTTTSSTVPAEPLARSELRIAVANATVYGGVAGAMADELEAIGYRDVAAINADNLPDSLVYAPLELLGEAARLAVDAGLPPDAVAPIVQLPPLFTDETFDMVLVLGLDSPAPESAVPEATPTSTTTTTAAPAPTTSPTSTAAPTTTTTTVPPTTTTTTTTTTTIADG